MKKILILFLFPLIILPVLSSGGYELSAQSRYSIDKKEKKRKYKRTRQERYEDRLVKKANKEKERKEKAREKQHKKDLKKYKKKVSGGGDELVDGKKVYRRMKRSERKANKFNDRRKPFWKRWFSKNSKPE